MSVFNNSVGAVALFGVLVSQCATETRPQSDSGADTTNAQWEDAGDLQGDAGNLCGNGYACGTFSSGGGRPCENVGERCSLGVTCEYQCSFDGSPPVHWSVSVDCGCHFLEGKCVWQCNREVDCLPSCPPLDGLYPGGEVRGTVAIALSFATGLVFATTPGDVIFADDSSRRVETPGGRIMASVSLNAGVAFVGSEDGKLYALSFPVKDNWQYLTAGSILSSAAIASDGTVYVGSDDGFLHAVTSDGQARWKFKTGGEVRSSPAIGYDGGIFFGSNDGNIYAVSPSGDGEWSYPTGAGVTSSPGIGADGTVVVGSLDHKVFALTKEGALKWVYETDGPVLSSPVIDELGHVYIGSNDGHLHAINPDGSAWWAFDAASEVQSSPALTQNGEVRFASIDGRYHRIKTDGTGPSSEPVCPAIYSSPSMLRDRFGTLGWYAEAIGCSDGIFGHEGPTVARLSATAPWPKFRANGRNTGNVADYDY